VQKVWRGDAAEACRRRGEIVEILGDRGGLPYPRKRCRIEDTSGFNDATVRRQGLNT
jgi:hypothetical protein